MSIPKVKRFFLHIHEIPSFLPFQPCLGFHFFNLWLFQRLFFLQYYEWIIAPFEPLLFIRFNFKCITRLNVLVLWFRLSDILVPPWYKASKNDPNKTVLALAPESRYTCAALLTCPDPWDTFEMFSSCVFCDLLLLSGFSPCTPSLHMWKNLSGFILAAAVVGRIPAGFALQHSQKPHIHFLKSHYAT